MRSLLAVVIVLLALAAFWLAWRWRLGALPRAGLVVLGLAVLAGGWWELAPPRLPAADTGADLRPLYDAGRTPPDAPLRAYHLGHSLVGRDMPAMLAQLAGHDYALQLGWGAALSEHFAGPQAVAGYQRENDTPHHREAHQALASGEYDALVMTEMVGLREALLYKDSLAHAGKWAAEAVAGNPDITIFLYETWHPLDDPTDWLARIPGDFDRMWSQILWSAARAADRPVWLIPAGQVMAAVVAEAEAGGIAELTRRQQLFSDQIHLGDLGSYLVALTHYAVLYGKSPVGLPHRLTRADASPATPPSPELARRMQEIVWQVVTAQPLTGVRAP